MVEDSSLRGKNAIKAVVVLVDVRPVVRGNGGLRMRLHGRAGRLDLHRFRQCAAGMPAKSLPGSTAISAAVSAAPGPADWDKSVRTKTGF
jgi:hypothetical protein